ILPPEPVKKSGEWKHNTFDYWVVHPGYGEFERFILRNGRAEEGDKRSDIVQMVALCIRLGEDAGEQLTYAQAFCLDPGLFNEFRKGVQEEIGFGSDPKT